MNLEIVAAVIGLIATAAGGVLANLASSWTSGILASLKKETPVKDVPKTAQPETLDQKRERHLKNRLHEMKAAIQKYEREAWVTRWSNNFLIAGQYVVGGTLASSFIQESMSSQTVGILGLIVLVATIFHQRYRPDVKSRVAKAKVSLLRSSLRRIEDELVITDSPNKTKIINRVTRVLNKVDEDEEWEIEDENESNQTADVNTMENGK